MIPGIHLKVKQQLKIIQNGRTDIVRFINDDYWSFPFLYREPCELFLNYPEVIWFSIGPVHQVPWQDSDKNHWG